jgi:deazaflavin-dependent oxidoreductase (nitroreductase family)
MRWLFKVPLWLYRADLGWLFGHRLARLTHRGRLARLTHRGRRSGRIRQTVVEVVRYEPRTREIVIAAAWGGQTDWYRNIQASPALEIRTGGTAYRPAQRFLTLDEMDREMRTYVRHHPWLARFVLPRLLGLPADASESQRRAAIAATIRGVVFWPATVSGARDRSTAP